MESKSLDVSMVKVSGVWFSPAACINRGGAWARPPIMHTAGESQTPEQKTKKDKLCLSKWLGTHTHTHTHTNNTKTHTHNTHKQKTHKKHTQHTTHNKQKTHKWQRNGR